MEMKNALDSIKTDKMYDGITEIRIEGFYTKHSDEPIQHTDETNFLLQEGLNQCGHLLNDEEYYSGLEYENGKFKIVMEKIEAVVYQNLSE